MNIAMKPKALFSQSPVVAILADVQRSSTWITGKDILLLTGICEHKICGYR